MDASLRSADIKHFLFGLGIAFVVSLGYMDFYHDSSLKKAVFGFFYFLITPFLALPHFPVAGLIMLLLFVLFLRVKSCMRAYLRWLAYALLWLHWIALGIFCARYVVI